MPKYRVLEKGFFGGVLREPGGAHDPVITAEPILKKEMPSWLQLITAKDEKAAEKAAKAAEVTVPNASADDFMGDDADVETL